MWVSYSPVSLGQGDREVASWSDVFVAIYSPFPRRGGANQTAPILFGMSLFCSLYHVGLSNAMPQGIASRVLSQCVRVWIPWLGGYLQIHGHHDTLRLERPPPRMLTFQSFDGKVADHLGVCQIFTVLWIAF